jgi:ATP-dependent DNA helicase DinG
MENLIILRNRLYADDADDLTVGSPFDYENAALLYIANDIAEPYQKQDYLKGIARAICDTAISIGGNILVLFTAYAQLKRISTAITPVLGDHDIHVFTQGQGASPNSLVESFKAAERGVLVGNTFFLGRR